ncbi:hypothetical protein BDW62DRAFT_159812 [Aspergillus aurantiobrunneus]
MLARLMNIFTTATTPSALLVMGNFGAKIHVLHPVPEDSTIERFSLTNPSSTTTFHHGGATEQTREQIGTVTLHVGDGDTANSFLDDVEARIRKRRDGSPAQQPGSVELSRLVQDVLRPAALDAIHEREGRDRSVNATQAYPVYVVHVKRSRAGGILTEPRSIA